jgi:hypothetical protein
LAPDNGPERHQPELSPSNAVRDAVMALVSVVPTYDSKNNLQNPVVRSIDLRG